MSHYSRKLRYCTFAIPGVIVGVIGMGLGVVLASPDIGWNFALFYSVVGLVGAPLATLAWGTNRLRRAQSFSGIALAAGTFGSMAILLELTVQYATIADVLARAPFVLAGWFAVWAFWISLALAKLVLFEPAYTRRHGLPR
jgi:hypothetical protein